MTKEDVKKEAEKVVKETAEVLYPASKGNYEVHINSVIQMQREAFIKGFILCLSKMTTGYVLTEEDVNKK